MPTYKPLQYNPLNEIHKVEPYRDYDGDDNLVVLSNSDLISDNEMEYVTYGLLDFYYDNHNLPKIEDENLIGDIDIDKNDGSEDAWNRVFHEEAVDTPEIYFIDTKSKAAITLMNKFKTYNLENIYEYLIISSNRIYFTDEVLNQIQNDLKSSKEPDILNYDQDIKELRNNVNFEITDNNFFNQLSQDFQNQDYSSFNNEELQNEYKINLTNMHELIKLRKNLNMKNKLNLTKKACSIIGSDYADSLTPANTLNQCKEIIDLCENFIISPVD